MTDFSKAAIFGLLSLAVTSRLVIYGPQELKEKFDFAGKLYIIDHIDFKIPASYANFGNIPYGQSMVGIS